MKKVLNFALAALVALTLFSCGEKKSTGKKAVVVVSFGTSFPESRKVTIEALEKQFAKEFKGWDIKRAFTSHIIRKVIKKKEGKTILDLKETLQKLADEGYSDVIVQSTHITRGAEYHDVYKTMKKFKDKFKSLRLGKALLSDHLDYAKAGRALATQFPKGAVVMMGHGNEHHQTFNRAYVKLQKYFDKKKMPVHIGLVEGEPGIKHVIKRLKKAGVKKVTLMPFMIVAGDHANNDMASDEPDSWKTQLQKAGIKVKVYLHGIGENEKVRERYIRHAKQAQELVIWHSLKEQKLK